MQQDTYLSTSPKVSFTNNYPSNSVNNNFTNNLTRTSFSSDNNLVFNSASKAKNYQDIISKSCIDDKLELLGYRILNKIIVTEKNGEKKTQYVKAINKKGQKLFVFVDIPGYTTNSINDVNLVETNDNIVPYSLKQGSYECSSKTSSGVAFECGSDSFCVIIRDSNNNPIEQNYMFKERNIVNDDGTVMSYPIIRFSELINNPIITLSNTDVATRRLRNSSYTSELQNMLTLQQSIQKLSDSFNRFNEIRTDVGIKIKDTLSQLEEWNNIYLSNLPITDIEKDKYAKLQYNLIQRNEYIMILLQVMKKVSDKHIIIDSITKEINEISDYTEKELSRSNIESVNIE